MIPSCQIFTGDAEEELKKLPSGSVQCVVTSPPYFGLRDYGDARQLGAEETPELYIARLVAIGREIRRVLRDDGTFWLNIGDSYSSGGRKTYDSSVISVTSGLRNPSAGGKRFTPGWAKPKDRLMIPARTAIELQADGWYLRDEIVWHKPNCMPESVTDRTTKTHEFIYLLTKKARYYYNAEAIKEPYSPETLRGVGEDNKYVNGAPGQTAPTMNMPRLHSKYTGQATKDYELALAQNPSDVKRRVEESILNGNGMANKKSVWSVSTAQFPGSHFATYPPDLIKPCILAGSRPGDTVADPFGGSGTTGEVALELGRSVILIELNPEYARMCEERCNVTPGLAL